MNIGDAFRDPRLPFHETVGGDTFEPMRSVIKSAFGEALTASEQKHFSKLCGNRQPPSQQVAELWICGGRRSGKDVTAAAVAVYIATVGVASFDLKSVLTKGERATVACLAVDREQAGVIFGYVEALFEHPVLAPLVKRRSGDTIELTNGVDVQVMTNDKRRTRGRTIIAAIFDEVGFWQTSEFSRHSAEEVIDGAIAPGMITIPNAIMIGISSPHAKRGLFYNRVSEHYGKDDPDVLVAWGATWDFNLTLSQDHPTIARAFKRDPLEAAAEWGGQFRGDLEQVFPADVLKSAMDEGTTFRPPQPGIKYIAQVDAASGSGADSYTLAVGHLENDRVVIDYVAERTPRFDPAEVTAEFAEIVKAYRVTTVGGDRYAGEFPRSLWRKQGITYVVNKLSTSDIYAAAVSAFMAGKVRLLDNNKVADQFATLERSNLASKAKIDHPSRGNFHDDMAASVAGVVWQLTKAKHGSAGRKGAALPIFFDLDTGEEVSTAPTRKTKTEDFASDDFRSWPLATHEQHTVRELIRKGKTKTEALKFVADHRTKQKGTPA